MRSNHSKPLGLFEKLEPRVLLSGNGTGGLVSAGPTLTLPAATIAPFGQTPPGIVVTVSSPTSWNPFAGSTIDGQVTWQWWNGSAAPNAVETAVLGIRDSSGHWVSGTTPWALQRQTPNVGTPGGTLWYSFSGMGVPAAAGSYSLVLGEEPATTDAAAIADFENGADAASAIAGPITASWATAGITVSGANPTAWSAATSGAISGSFTAQYWAGSGTATGVSLVVGIHDAAGHWVGGTLPQEVSSWQYPPIGTPSLSVAMSFTNLSVPTTPGSYSVVVAQEPSANAIAAFEASADIACDTVGTLTASRSLTTWGPLLQFPTWNQSGPVAYGSNVNFNDYAPLDPATGTRSDTGCTATAIAEILYYWHCPLSISFSQSDAYTSMAGTAWAVNIDGDAATYDFPTLAALNSDLSSIQYNGSPTEEALLAFGVGVKVKADYTSSGTSAGWGADTFGTLGFQSADWSGDWATIKPTVISNIESGLPVLLNVPNHMTVIDGYDSVADTFHISFGWGGDNDGWYSLPGVGDFPGSNIAETVDSVAYNIEPILPAPTAVAASTGLPGHVHLSWDASDEASSYQVWRNSTNNSATATLVDGNVYATSYDDTTAVAGQTQYYWVKSATGAGTGGFSAVASGSCPVEAPGIVVTLASPTYWTASTSGSISGQVTWEWWNGSSAPNATETAVLGIRDSSGNWAAGTTPWAIQRQTLDMGTPNGSWWYSYGGLGLPATAGTYEVVLGEEPAGTDAAAIADFESGADAAAAIVGSVTTFTTPDPRPATPSNLTPSPAATNVLTTPTLTASALSVTDSDTQVASQWRVTLVSDGTVKYDSGTDSADKTSITLPAGVLDYSTMYDWQVRYEDSGGMWSYWSSATSFTTGDPAPTTPTNLSPADAAAGVTVNRFRASPFRDADGDLMQASEWKLVLASNGTQVADWTSSGTSSSVPGGLLTLGTAYRWQVRYEGLGGLWSGWSTATSFTIVASPFSLVGSTLTVAGDGGNNAFSCTVGAGQFTVGIDGNTQTYPASSISDIVLNGGGGNDSAVINGGGGAAVATVNFSGAAGTVTTPGYTVTLTGINTKQFIGQAGDVATLTAASAADVFTAHPTYATLAGGAFSSRIDGCGSVTAKSVSGTNSNVAYLYDSAGNDTFYAKPTYAYLMGTGFYNRANGFSAVYATATAGGTDAAKLYDSAGNDTFCAKPTYAYLQGTGFYYRANGFHSVYAYSTAGGTDKAYLHDSAGNDMFYGTHAYGYMQGTGFLNYASAFKYVYAYGTTGTDSAYLYDSAGNDKFYATAKYSYLSGTGFYNCASAFKSVYAYASTGTDSAYLYDSAGNDTYVGNKLLNGVTSSYMSGSGLMHRATGFDNVYAYATAGGTDTAYLYDTAGNDAFVGNTTSGGLTSSYMSGSGLMNRATGFGKVYAYATAGGTDTAYVYGTGGADQFHARSNWGQLTQWPTSPTSYFVYFSGFDSTTVNSSSGADGHDVDSSVLFPITYLSTSHWITRSG